MKRTLAELVAAAGTPRWRGRRPEAPWPVEVDTCRCGLAVFDDPQGHRRGHPDAPQDLPDGRTIHTGCIGLEPPAPGDVDRTELDYLATTTSATVNRRQPR